MAKLNGSLLAIVLAVTALPAWAKDTTYHDPRNPSFSVLVPDGWLASKTDSGVDLHHGNSNVMVWVVTGNIPPADMVANITSQFQKQAKEFRMMDKGECRFGGQKGAYTVFSGISPNGTPEVTRIINMTNGQLQYTMVQQSRPNEYESEKAEMQRIQDSFAPDAAVTSVDDREKLDALYAAGVINKQQYDARVKNLGGSANATPAAPPAGATNAVNTPPAPAANSANASAGSDAYAQKLAALDQAYRSGVLTREEYESKKQQLQQPGGSGPSTANANGDHNGGRFQAPDGSYSTVMPSGWTAQRTGSGGQATDTFFPTDGGQERIMISTMKVFLGIQQVTTGMATMTTQMFPALQLTQMPAYGQIDGNPASELHYQGILADGARISAWQGVRLIGKKYYSVFSVARWNRAAAVEADAQAMLRGLQVEGKR